MKKISLATALFALASGVAAQIPPNGYISPGQTVTIGQGEEVHRTGPILVAGGQLLVSGGKLFLNGTMTIVHGGAVVFDAAEFHHEGEDTHVFVGGTDSEGGGGNGFLTFRNGSRLRWAQSYFTSPKAPCATTSAPSWASSASRTAPKRRSSRYAAAFHEDRKRLACEVRKGARGPR